MIDYDAWARGLTAVLIIAPCLLIFMSILFARVVCYFYLEKMLAALGGSPLFSSCSAQGVKCLGFMSRSHLFLDIGTALFFAKSNVRSGVMDAIEVRKFPCHLKVMALINFFLFYSGLFLIFIGVAVIKGWRSFSGDHELDPRESLLFIIYASPVLAFTISSGLTVYACQRHLCTMVKAIKKDHIYRSRLDTDMKLNGRSWRSVLFAKIGMAVLFKGGIIRGIDLSVFDYENLPARLKRLALVNLLWMDVGIFLVFFAVVVFFLNKP